MRLLWRRPVRATDRRVGGPAATCLLFQAGGYPVRRCQARPGLL